VKKESTKKQPPIEKKKQADLSNQLERVYSPGVVIQLEKLNLQNYEETS
jgi:hypothetical protein